MPRAARLILATALIATVLAGPAARSAKAPPSTPTDDQPPMICFEEPCWGEGCENDCGCEDECGVGKIIDPCDHVPCGIIDPCDHVNCDPDPCNYVNCNPDIPCRDKPCPEVCRPGLDYRECADTVCGYLGLAGLSSVAGVDCVETACDIERDLGIRLVYTGDSDGDGIEDCHDPDVDGDGLSNVLEGELELDPTNPDNDGDRIPPSLDLIPDRDLPLQIRVTAIQLDLHKQTDLGTADDPYLDNLHLAWTSDFDPDESFHIPKVRKGDHVHNERSINFAEHTIPSDDQTPDGYPMTVLEFSQDVSAPPYVSYADAEETRPKAWHEVGTLWDHDDPENCQPLDGGPAPPPHPCEDELEGDEEYGPSDETVEFNFFAVAKVGRTTPDFTAMGANDKDEEDDIQKAEKRKTFEFRAADGTLEAEFTVGVAVNAPRCAFHLVKELQGLAGLSDDEEDGNPYLGLGTSDDPPNGAEMTASQMTDCKIDG